MRRHRDTPPEATPRAPSDRDRRLELRELRDAAGLSLHLTTQLYHLLEQLDDELEAAESAATPADRDEHARQAFWAAEAASLQAAGIAADAEELAAALPAAFDAPDPRADPESRWWSRVDEPPDQDGSRTRLRPERLAS